MYHTRTIAFLGFVIAVMPFLGFPGAVRTFVIVFAALAITGFALLDLITTRLERQYAEDVSRAKKTEKPQAKETPRTRMEGGVPVQATFEAEKDNS